ncbi:MAG: sigma-70 family RNA polymerase sigma factor [Clostridiales Family XIII bacterium]|jgi:RNA polymerase sigma-70 factor (ECF subfamily)|nr:sigma-70 family RNA polymerase sigma factor [Clostridiales Family XIII bacterium]
MEESKLVFEEVYSAYALEIKRFIFTSARRDAELTEDIFQNTWMNAYRYLSSVKDVGAVRAWLYSIARNEAKRYFYEHRTWLFPEGITGEQNAGAEPEDEVESAFPEALANADLLERLLSGLGDAEQQLILLHYGYDMSLKDVAELYGANYNTLKSSMRRAVGRLRQLAQEEI